LKEGRQPAIAVMGLAFKPNIDDLRESPAIYIAERILQDSGDADMFIVEPNVHDHKVFKLTNYKEAVEKADIIVFLVAHNEFKTLEIPTNKVVLDFCGIKK
jgi:UDP-N-acetyl-D-mannosaminuronic acid dehydrogenase